MGLLLMSMATPSFLFSSEPLQRDRQGSTIRVALWPGASKMLCWASASGTDLPDRASGHHDTPVWTIVTLTKCSLHTNLNKNSPSIQEKSSVIIFNVMEKHCIRASKS